MKIYLYDSLNIHENLLPLSFTRPVGAFRCGIMTIREKWEHDLPGEYDYYPVKYLRDAFCKELPGEDEEMLFISGNLLPDEKLIEQLAGLENGEALFNKEEPVAYKGNLKGWESKSYKRKDSGEEFPAINYIFDLFLRNYEEIEKDFERKTKDRKSQPLPACVKACVDSSKPMTNHKIFIEEGALVECISINLTEGSVYIGKDAVLMEGSSVRGPLAICEGSEVRMGSKIYGGTTIGPHSKVGGEIDNTVIFGYSNKAHDGYLGNAVIGEWCNIGAGVNASNLKNDYSLIRVWNYKTGSFMKTGLQFCGLIMGDHSKIGINCMLNTATVMGVGVNLHGSGFPRTYLPNFHDGSPGGGFKKVSFRKFEEMAERMMSRRDIELGEKERKIFEEIYEKFA